MLLFIAPIQVPFDISPLAHALDIMVSFSIFGSPAHSLNGIILYQKIIQVIYFPHLVLK